MKPRKSEIFIATGFYTGFSPLAPGTAGSLLAAAIYMIPGFELPYVIGPVIIISFFYGVKICAKMEYLLGKDPSECTIDEFVGTWISFYLLPKKLLILIIAFFIWRILDILKPPPARALEDFEKGWGVMLDDVASGIYTALIMHLLLFLKIIP